MSMKSLQEQIYWSWGVGFTILAGVFITNLMVHEDYAKFLDFKKTVKNDIIDILNTNGGVVFKDEIMPSAMKGQKTNHIH